MCSSCFVVTTLPLTQKLSKSPAGGFRGRPLGEATMWGGELRSVFSRKQHGSTAQVCPTLIICRLIWLPNQERIMQGIFFQVMPRHVDPIHVIRGPERV